MSVKYEIIKWFFKTIGFKNRGTMCAEEIIAFKKKQNAKIGIPNIQDKQIQVSRILVMDCPVIRMVHPGKTNKATLFITGGGMVGMPQPSMVKKALTFAKETGTDVYFPYYPLCTDYPLTRAYEMIYETYKTMLREYRHTDISVAGFSSGGNLGLGLIAYMNDVKSDLPRPGYILAVSPGSGPVSEEERIRLKALDAKDLLVSAEYISTAEKVMRYWGDVPDYMIFLQKGDFTNCPKVTFIYGTDEVLYALAPTFESVMKKYNVAYEMVVGEGMFHAYPAFPVVKESKEGWKQMIEIVRRNIGYQPEHV